MVITQNSPKDFINSLDSIYKKDIQELDKFITEINPSVEKVMWEGKFWGSSEQKIIGYGRFTAKRSDKKIVEWFIVGLALQKNYITIFVTGVEDDMYIVEKYKDQLGKAKIGKSTISFKKIEDINLNTLKIILNKALKQKIA